MIRFAKIHGSGSDRPLKFFFCFTLILFYFILILILIFLCFNLNFVLFYFNFNSFLFIKCIYLFKKKLKKTIGSPRHHIRVNCCLLSHINGLVITISVILYYS